MHCAHDVVGGFSLMLCLHSVVSLRFLIFKDRRFFGWFVCLGLMSHSRIFHTYGDITNTGEGLYTASMALNCEDSLACHTYCDTVHPFIMVIFEDL